MVKKILIATILFSIVVIVAITAYEHGYLRFNYPNKKRYPIRGIDVSHHQGKVDWDLVKEENLHFVFIKATEGGDFKDTQFDRNWQEASRIGLIKGAYHFFTFCKPGIEQARNFIDTVPVDNNDLPPVIDFEFSGNCSQRPTKTDLLKEFFNFANAVKARYGKSPIIYATYTSYKEYLEGEIDNYHVWIRDIFWTPELPNLKPWTFWQYTNRGRIKGIKGLVDLNVFAHKDMWKLKSI
ncbi:MAG: GH25 family lysozyme [Desulfobacteraceae bacterium]|jgi:lysozyme